MIIKNYKQLATSVQRKNALQIINSGLQSCKAENFIKKKFSTDNCSKNYEEISVKITECISEFKVMSV